MSSFSATTDQITSQDSIREYITDPAYIILNRESNTNPNNSESMLKITPDYTYDARQPTETFYRVEWIEDRNTNRKIAGKTYSFMATRTRAMEYIATILDMICHDEIPFHSMDLLIPCFPSVSYSAKSFNKVRPIVDQALSLYL